MNKEINFVFVVDIYNEGVDIPQINTVLFLRPTESLTVFLQQLGRGLRLCEGKEALTVLDFVGQANRKYNFEDRFKALLSRTRRTVEHEIKEGFTNVPKGCSIQLEKQAEEYILSNIRNSINNKKNLVSKLNDYMDVSQDLYVREYFENYHVSPQDVYGKRVTISELAVQAGLIKGHVLDPERESLMATAFGRLSLANSRRWLAFLRRILPQIRESGKSVTLLLTNVERTMLNMLHYTIWGKGLDDLKRKFNNIEQAIFWAIDDHYVYNELMSLLDYQYERIQFVYQLLD